MSLRFQIWYTNGYTNERVRYGAASHREGADALVGSLKIQPVQAREIEVKDMKAVESDGKHKV